MLGLKEKVAIVTGGATGLGAGIVRRFVAEGVAVVVADILEEAGRSLQGELGERCEFVRTDLRNDTDLDQVLQAAQRQFGGLDFLLNVACSYSEGGAQSSRQQWQTGFDINVFGHAVLLQKAVPLLKNSKNASVVNFASSSGRIAQMSRWVYPATKAATEQLTRSAALELAEHGIRVNALLPGVIGKPPSEYPSPEAYERVLGVARRSNIQSRLQDPAEIADVALFLCSEHSRSMTGTTLVADSGCLTLGPLGKEVHVPRRAPAA